MRSLRDYNAAGQIGLEPTVREYVQTLVDVFREVRRVLAPHGTAWLNIGDTYNAYNGNRGTDSSYAGDRQEREPEFPQGHGLADPTLKPKDLCLVPERLVIALQDDGWWVRSDVIWGKPNPMPESARDRPTKSHEYVFMLTKQSRYFFDQEGVREPAEWNRWGDQTVPKYEGTQTSTGWMKPQSKETLTKRRTVRPGVDVNGGGQGNGEMEYDPRGRNMRSVWWIPTQPNSDAHFATYPEKLVERALLASCPERVCRTCGQPSERIVESESSWGDRAEAGGAMRGNVAFDGNVGAGTQRGVHASGVTHDLSAKSRETVGWSDCGHDDWRQGIVLDPFMGSGTTAITARRLGRACVGVELSREYAEEIIVRRTAQLSLLAG